jgi:CheY-like chemotaxis protein
MSGTISPEITAPVGSSKTHLLVVEDEPVIRELFSTLLQTAGYSVAQAQDGFDALEEIRRRRPALILSDLNMPRMTGFELLSVIRRRFPSVHVIAMSGAFDDGEVPDGVAADAFYQKSGRHISTLVQVIEDLLRSDAAKPHPPSQPEDPPQVALWVSRRGTPVEGPYILLTCNECLRSFPHSTGEECTMHVCDTPCIFCGSPISYALLDPSITHHPGYAPSATP